MSGAAGRPPSIRKHQMDDELENVTATIEPMHPGSLLREMMSSQPKERRDELSRKTEMSATVLEDIMECKAPIDRNAALRLRTVFGDVAEIWYRMQFQFDHFSETHARPSAAQLPRLDV